MKIVADSNGVQIGIIRVDVALAARLPLRASRDRCCQINCWCFDLGGKTTGTANRQISTFSERRSFFDRLLMAFDFVIQILGAREIDDRLRVTSSEHLSATHCGRFPHSSIIPQQPQGVPLNDRSTVVRRARGHGLVRLSALRIFEKLKNHSNPHSWVCSLKTVKLTVGTKSIRTPAVSPSDSSVKGPIFTDP